MPRRAKPAGLQTSTSGDRFATVRKEARKVLELLQREIRRAEADLHELVEQARIWEQAIGLGEALPAGPAAKRGRRPKPSASAEGDGAGEPKAPRKLPLRGRASTGTKCFARCPTSSASTTC